MATLKRTDSKTPKDKPPRTCLICTEVETEGITRLIRPCRNCENDYCEECLVEMFVAAIESPSRMPPKCCSLIQIHMVLDTELAQLSESSVEKYREKFEEWIAPVKTYCPSPTCSAFISEKLVPDNSSEDPKGAPPSISSVLRDVLSKLSTTGSARFFRGEMDITMLPGFTNVVKQHIDLSIMQNKIDQYRSIDDLTKDMDLLASNAAEYNGQGHPVTAAAKELYRKYMQEVSFAVDHLVNAGNASASAPQTLFACPKCHIAICSSCKQIEHTGEPCDESLGDHETAMLATFGYKRCPRCKAGVKKMYGCPHMQCVCGAHWCYYCQRPINECDGECSEREFDEAENDYDSEEDSMDGRISPPPPPGPPPGPPPPPSPPPPPPPPQQQPATNAAAPAHRQPANHAAPPSSLRDDFGIVNLDAGGDRRWAEGDYDFGNEPDEVVYSQIWSCHHTFKPYEAPPNDGYNRGDLEAMECNRCFGKVNAQKKEVPGPKGRKRSRSGGQNPKTNEVVDPEVGLECRRCGLLVCVKCKEKYNSTEGAQ